MKVDRDICRSFGCNRLGFSSAPEIGAACEMMAYNYFFGDLKEGKLDDVPPSCPWFLEYVVKSKESGT